MGGETRRAPSETSIAFQKAPVCVCMCIRVYALYATEIPRNTKLQGLHSLLADWCDLFFLHTKFFEQTEFLSSFTTSVCFKHLGARSRAESRSDTLSNSHCFQPLMFHHCYEAVQLTAPVLWSHASGISHTASDEYASRRPAMSVGFNMLALQMCNCLTRLPAALLESVRLSKSRDRIYQYIRNYVTVKMQYQFSI